MTCIYIYKMTNKINGKIYIGQTVDFDKRMKQHEYGRNTKNNCVIDIAIKKYKINNFKCEIIDKEDNQESADNLEKHYIKINNSLVPKGYNVLIGGRNQCGAWNSKIVYMYDLQGNFIEKFKSASEIERKSKGKYARTLVCSCCRKKQKRCKDRIFRYDFEYVSEYQKPVSSRSVKVYQFDLKGNLIKKFNSIQEASNATNSSRTGILGCLKGTYKTSNGFLWKYDNQCSPINKSVIRTRILQYDENNNFIKEFVSCAEAERFNNFKKGSYKTIWKNIDKNKKTYGYYWISKKK